MSEKGINCKFIYKDKILLILLKNIYIFNFED